MATIGVRRETKSIWERRAAVTPELAGRLVASGHTVQVERSERRIFKEAEYTDVGATLVDELSDCDLIIGVKEVPEDRFGQGLGWVFFAHVIKGQAYNMGMLRTMLDQELTLIDYERIVDEDGRRLVFFGRHAGLAGMIDSLWTLGARARHEGIASPFDEVDLAHSYNSLEEALAAVKKAGERIRIEGVPEALHPVIIGVTGGGNVSRGAHEVLDVLPIVDVTVAELASLTTSTTASRNQVYRVRLEEEQLVRRIDGGELTRPDYYANPERYESTRAEWLPHLSMLINGIYWTEAYPRLVRNEDLPMLARCRVIGDISCDIRGSVQATVLATEPGEPVYTYDRVNDAPIMGVAGELPVICAVDILPAELPREASHTFAAALTPFIDGLAACDFTVPYEALDLPAPMKAAVIAHQGKLAPDYAYIADFMS